MPLTIPTLHKIEAIKKESSEVKSFTSHSMEIAKESKPGQFVMVWDPGVDEIPISIALAVLLYPEEFAQKIVAKSLSKLLWVFIRYLAGTCRC
jgi:hypothetical protein